MNEPSSRNTMFSRGMVIAGSAVLILLLLLGGLRLSLKTRWVQQFARDQLLSYANEYLEGDLSVKRLEGDLWNTVQLRDIRLADAQNNHLLTVDSLRIQYNIWTLIRGPFQIKNLSIDKPWVHLEQDTAGRWNLLQVIRIPEGESAPFYFNIGDIGIDNGEIGIYPTSANQADSAYHFRELKVRAGGGRLPSGFEIRLNTLRFLASVPMLTDTLSFQSQARYADRKLSLDKLLISTGESMLATSGSLDTQEDTYDFQSFLKPLSGVLLKDITRLSMKQNLDVRLSLEGKGSSIRAGLSARAPALDTLHVNAGFRWDSLLAMEKVNVEIAGLDGPSLVEADSIDWPRVEQFQADFNGYVPFQQWKEGSARGTVSIQDFAFMNYRVERFGAEASYDKRTGKLTAFLQRGRERVEIDATVNESDNSPRQSWSMDISAESIRPKHWWEEAPAGSLNAVANLSGKGFEPGVQPWKFSLLLRESSLQNQPFKLFKVNGSIDSSRIDAQAEMAFQKSKLDGDFKVREYHTDPQYEFDIRSDDFDVNDIAGLSPNSSKLRLRAHGEGRGISPENIKLTSRISLDSSSINKAAINELHAMVHIEDSVLKIQEADLKSEMANGRFSARQHLMRFYSDDNRLDFDLELKNLQPLASFFKTDFLEARGTVNGDIRPTSKQHLSFDGSVDLNNIRYDTLLNVQGIKGSVQVDIKQDPTYMLTLDIEQPEVASVVLQDINLQSKGELDAEETRGQIEIKMTSGTGGALQQKGRFHLQPDSVTLRTNEMTIQTPAKDLALSAPFQIYYYDDRLMTDTLRMTSSSEQPFLELAVPRFDSLSQQVYFKADRLDMQAIQEVLLGRFYIGGDLTGYLMLDKRGESVELKNRIQLTDLRYENLRMDSVMLTSRIENDRFSTDLSVHHRQQEIMTGGLDLPFRLGDPRTFEDEFFDQEVQGYVQVNPVDINTIEGAGELLGFAKTNGTIRIDGVLRGTAGQPSFTGFANMYDATWSGVPIDSATTKVNYLHDERKLELSSSVISLKQRALDIEAELPMHMDMRRWMVELPNKEKSLSVTAEVKDFNLSSLNEFMNRNYVQNLKGSLDGKVTVTGSFEDPSLQGELRLRKSSMRLPQVGVTYGDINGTLVFRDKEVRLTDLTVKNGGSLKAHGLLDFEGTKTVDMDFEITARNFKAAHTSQYQFIVNSNAKLQGGLFSPSVTGDLTIQRGYLNLTDFGDKTVERVELEAEQGQSEDAQFSVYDSLDITMNLAVKPEFILSNQKYANMEVGLDGSVEVVKEKGKELQLFGTIGGREGYFSTLGKKFKMETAQLLFSGNSENPVLDMRFSYEPPQPKENIVIYYVVTGTLKDPEFEYESEPEMELENIISYTLFGQPYYALDSWKQVVANPGKGGMATGLMTEALLNRVESIATQKLSVDVVEIDTYQSGNVGVTSIKTGWYINERTFLAILNYITGSTPSTAFILEYTIKKNLDVILRQGNKTREGIDLHWHKDY